MNIYVGNLHQATTDSELREAFEAFGAVNSASIVKDRVTGLPRGFAFVEMPTDLNAAAAIRGLDGHDLGGHSLTVQEARPHVKHSVNGFGNRGLSGDHRG